MKLGNLLSGGDGQVGILGSVLEVAIPQVNLSADTIDHREVGHQAVLLASLVGSVVLKQFLGLLEVGEDELHHVFVRNARIVLGLILGGVLIDDGNGETLHSRHVGVFVLGRLEEHHQHIVVESTASAGYTGVSLCIGVLLISHCNDRVGGLHKLIECEPRQVSKVTAVATVSAHGVVDTIPVVTRV